MRALITTRVVGVTKVPNNVSRLYAIRDALQSLRVAKLPPKITVRLVRAPQNPADANAIEVHVPPVGMIGWIAREKAAELAPYMDGKKGPYVVTAEIIDIPVQPEHPDNPGAVITVHTDVC